MLKILSFLPEIHLSNLYCLCRYDTLCLKFHSDTRFLRYDFSFCSAQKLATKEFKQGKHFALLVIDFITMNNVISNRSQKWHKSVTLDHAGRHGSLESGAR